MPSFFLPIRFSICSFVLAIVLPSMALGFVQTQLDQLKNTKACAGCDLLGADLRGADLRGADLQEADLRAANVCFH